MKRNLLILSSLFVISIVLTGCSLGKNMSNTPTKRVEEYLGNYQTLHSNVIEKIESVVGLETTFTDTQKETYKEALKKHYQDLTYEIKEETVNGDKATVEAEIEVNDYSKVLKEAEAYKQTNADEFKLTDGSFDEAKYNDYKLDKIKDAKDRVKYTIYFSLTKNTDGKWELDDLTETEENKILGIYEY